jgi:Secretion system C-terminal sorting domain
VGFAGSSTARRYNIMEQSAGLQFPIGSDPNTGALYVEDIEALPGIPGSVAISRMNNGFSPRHEGVAIYDDGVARPMTTQDHTGSNRIEFNSANSMLGYNNETTEFGLRRISVTAGGVNEVTVSQSILSGFYLDFIYHGNYVYATDGTVVDVAAAPFVAGHFNGAAGPAVYDDFNGLVCYATSDFSGVITFQRYSPASFLLQDAMPIGQAFGFVFNIISCGEDCYAFNTEDNKVIILDKFTSLAGDLESNNRPLTIYPNPVTDYFSIEAGNYAFTKVSIIGIDGKAFRNYDTLSGNKYDISDLEKGIYMVKMLDENGQVLVRKIIK